MVWLWPHVEPRQSQLLLAGCIELRELGDGGNLTEQPQPIKTPLLNGTGRPRQLRRPAHLALDLLNEEANLLGGPLRLLALNADQGLGVLAVGEKDLEQAVAEQGYANDRKEQADIFSEQRPTDMAPAGHLRNRREDGRRAIGPCFCRRHSITSSARAARVGATSSPIALAVLRLIDSWNRAACCTGRSPGFAPLRMRST